MIIKEPLTIKNKAFIKTYSDKGFMVECDGVRYAEAIDLEYLGREYVETDEPIEPAEGGENRW